MTHIHTHIHTYTRTHIRIGLAHSSLAIASGAAVESVRIRPKDPATLQDLHTSAVSRGTLSPMRKANGYEGRYSGDLSSVRCGNALRNSASWALLHLRPKFRI
jgi:hypothetical protein